MNHPDDDALRALSLGQLAEAELLHVSAHLGDCSTCCCRIDQLASNDRLLTRLQQNAESKNEPLVTSVQRRSAVRALRQSRETRSATRILPIPRQIGDYEILSEVGRGGMGVVYKARHQGLNRLAAVKMVLAAEFASPTQELRFRLEAELAARVRHLNIVQVYEIGSYEGRPFLALEWVEGGSLADRLERKPWPAKEATSLIETLARAIHVAHGEGIVHRDLKPANILLQTVEGGRMKDETHTSFLPKITDFGLAQTIEGGQSMTQTGFLLGTPEYMAPEQASGKRALVGPATDIYALGVMLYRLLTGRLPFQCDNTLELLRAVTSDEPTTLRRLEPRVPRDLEAITLHCLEKEPGRRYSSALALAEDLQRFREGKQVEARPVGTAARLVRAGRRRPLVALLLGLLTVSLIGGLGGVAWKWQEANANAHQAEAEKQVALYQAYRACLAAASAALQNHDVLDADRLLQAAPEALRGWEWRHLQSRLDDSSQVVPLPDGGGGFLIPTSGRLLIGVFTDSRLRVTDLAGGEHGTLPIGPERRRHASVTQTSRGLRVVVWDGTTTLDVLNESGQTVCRVLMPENGNAVPVVMSPDGTRLCVMTGGEQKHIQVFDATSGKQTAICSGHDDAVWSIRFSPDSSRIASASEDRTVRVWDAATGTLLSTLRGHTSKVVSVSFSPDGSRLATCSSDGSVRQWDIKTSQEAEPPYERHSAEIFCAVYSPDGQSIASAGRDRTIRVWRARGRQDMAVLHGHTERVTDVAFTPDGRRLASLSTRWSLFGGGDETARVWDVDPQATLPALQGHTRAIYPVAFSPDGRWLASGSWDGTARLWDAATGEPGATLPHSSFVWDLAFGPDGTWLATACDRDDRLRIWDTATARVRKEIPLPGRNFRLLTVNPDGTRLAVTAYDSKTQTESLTVCDIVSGKPLFTAEGFSLAYSPDGRWLATLSADRRTVLLLDARTHETVAQFSGHEIDAFKAAFSPDSRRLALCCHDRTVRLWQIDPLATQGECQVLRGHTHSVYTVAFHPDGTRLATAGDDGLILLWDLTHGEEVVRLPGHKGFVWSLAFSKDGATLASGSGDATVRLWDTAPLKTRYQARREAAASRKE